MDMRACNGGFGYGRRNLEGEYIQEACVALDMVVCNTKIRKSPTESNENDT